MKLMSTLIATAVLAGSALYTTPASANDRLAISICEYIAADDKNRLRKTLRSARLKIRDISDAVKCNGNNLVRHAVASNAVDTGEYIIKSLPKSSLEDGADLNWATSNHAGSPLIAAIKDRAGL
ncbi:MULTISPECIES: DUF3718 domain-containing protein [Pseudoalteromonas]|uniref:DUF3718 domain-containing protein n=1 Tax=Pseudoalteromonas ruthenica TaxID=151081 RepID=A0A0F4PW33_9GAMM|nr:MULTISPECIES: DUF3718 domain-containing protein [Pseudoalteromonas]KJY96615.1 hypothetical protein TW76_11145 [Pseudoalteromonas ruthenica]KJY98486.1 hypothetical protein TW72_12160 [Pseudoalteromonas ruthenica]MCF2862251.1 DUF3718 domain-containing protein [Pseudoalteromonas sp. CNAT2-18]MCG7544582.1 DUF3718 domain-containing protein [Pseudoalteromonas sp. MM17-2]MCG7557980.1 DUF3718 domain-containing protein [Pseudoalteromonas sp. CNAT2-18.1]|tara:strand:+ start:1128 stop:1499 length:372 start_codon:yes stop_codon:yes gene_type:complete